MHIRVRHPGGQSNLTLSEDAQIQDLEREISVITGLSSFELKHGYPPQQLSTEDYERTYPLSRTGLKFDREQLIVSPKLPPNPESSISLNAREESNPNLRNKTKAATITPSFSLANVGTTPSARSSPGANKPLRLSRKADRIEQDSPEIPLPALNATIVLRIMPDDNSCLFRAFNSAFFGLIDNMQELRSIIAQHIQANPETYPAVVLDKNPDDYCRWIQTEDAWGGAIELDILSKHFDVEICSIDVQTLRVDRFNEGRPSRCILVFSGIHYDTIALSPSDPAQLHSVTPPDFDTKVFDRADHVILQAAVELCRLLQKMHYYTDTSKFSIKCRVCNTIVTGERGASEHAINTGHTDFGEAG